VVGHSDLAARSEHAAEPKLFRHININLWRKSSCLNQLII
jgi:hypothetical protein